jgi:hypothetical protein
VSGQHSRGGGGDGRSESCKDEGGYDEDKKCLKKFKSSLRSP